MANISYTDTCRSNKLDEITALVDAGSGAGKLRIYDGSQPADADTAISGQTLLAELTFSDPSFGAASGGVLTANSITSDSSANASGTAAWFRVVDSDANAVFDGDVSTSAAGTGDLQLDSTSITAGQTVSVSSFVITEGSVDA
jgi:hypothetical protein